MKLYIATKNENKVREINNILGNSSITCLIYPNMADVAETGETFEENAKIKANYLSSLLKDEYVIADDSGLSVDILKGEPGVYSARYAGVPSNDKKNNEKLLKEMKSKSNRKAKFICAIAISKNGKTLQVFHGEIEGHIAKEEKGENGFGYDSVFLIDNNKTLAEIPSEEKNKISHRYKALNQLKEFLSKIK